MDELERLSAIEEIRKLKARYFRCMDTKDWDEVRNVFALDAIFDVRYADCIRDLVTGAWTPPCGGDDCIFRGREAIVHMMEQRVGSLYTIHHGHMPEIEFRSDVIAGATWAMEDLIYTTDRRLLLHGFGHYDDTYERLASGWVIRTTKLQRLYLIPGTQSRLDEGGR